MEYRVRFNGTTHYDATMHDIDIAMADRYRMGAICHEYGHHVVSSYGLWLLGCVDDVSEGERITETFASIFQLLYLADDSVAINMAYNADPNDGTMDPHRMLGNGWQDDGNDCNAADIHDEGLGLEQAMWELMYGRDCSTIDCSGSHAPFFQNALGIWGAQVTQEQALDFIGDALGTALSNTPDTTTYEDLVAQMSARWTVLVPTRVNQVMNVIHHHGR